MKCLIPFFCDLRSIIIEKAAMRKQMEEEIRHQLQANDNAMMSWDDKVYINFSCISKYSIKMNP